MTSANEKLLSIVEAERELEKYDARLSRLEKLVKDTDSSLHRVYARTLEELRFFLDQFRSEIVRARQSGRIDELVVRRRLHNTRDRTHRLFETRLATIRHQDL